MKTKHFVMTVPDICHPVCNYLKVIAMPFPDESKWWCSYRYRTTDVAKLERCPKLSRYASPHKSGPAGEVNVCLNFHDLQFSDGPTHQPVTAPPAVVAFFDGLIKPPLRP